MKLSDTKRTIVRAAGTLLLAMGVGAYGAWAQAAEAREQERIAARIESGERGPYLKDGTFSGQARSFGGMMNVDVTVSNGYIADIQVTHTYDDSPFFDRAEEGMIPRIIQEQTTEVDLVTSATYSSRGIKNAVNNTLIDAGALVGEKASANTQNVSHARSTAELKELAAARKSEQEAKAWYELSFQDLFGSEEEEEFSGRHDSTSNVSGGFAAGV